MATATSSSVCSLIAAFTNGLNIFKKFQSQSQKCKKKRGSKDASQSADSASETAEQKLTKSLHRGSVDVQKVYEQNYRAGGEKYAQGDAIATLSLSHTLLTLNTALASIISSFLHPSPAAKNGKLSKLDYASLTSISETSRAEAVEALGQLYERLSSSNVTLKQPQQQPQPHPPKRREETAPLDPKKRTEPRPPTNQGGCATERRRARDPEIRKLNSGTSDSQLALVRPRNRRTGSSSTTTSSKSQSSRSTASTPQTRATPPPLYTSSAATPISLSSGSSPASSPKTADAFNARTAQHFPSVPVQPRRADKVIPSFYSAGSASTKIGEIPMRKWNEPYDYEGMERLNREMIENGWAGWGKEGEEEKEKEKKGRGRLRRLFGRGQVEV
ncbi:hypothetical protein K402DRAFT_462124 [Aulographum hederae CBS 113979]|uniref:Uncharacterized protein n=1 Tax=Aulographum hederae CBS 113979 TaxID=1176131 RepID=A0A6G1H4T0_9PEZI|nr:hypothetical protein K402DRAFT_462124 [Aulographum hederae CBS 113979]